jgi:hypothetical protein
MNNVWVSVCLNSIHGQTWKKQSVEISGLPTIEFSWIMLPEIQPGQTVIAAINQEERLSSLYILDIENCPYQIAGTRDLLLDSEFYIDLRGEYTQVVSDLEAVFWSAYEPLTLQEMSCCSYLRDWEQQVKSIAVRQKMSMAQIIKICEQTIAEYPNPKLSSRIIDGVKIVKRVKKKPWCHINWGEYDLKLQK